MTTELTATKRSYQSVLQAVLLTCSLVFLVFADVLAFNQIATQSATDVILHIVVFAIGGAGIFEFLRRVLCSRSASIRWTAIIPAALSLAAFGAWRAQAPVCWFVLITLAATAFLAVITIRSFWGSENDEDSESIQLIGLLCLAQTIVFAYVAALAVIDAGSALFG
jgi:fatty-acid desaturase